MRDDERRIHELFAGLQDPLSRRELLRRAGRGSVFLGMGALLAACGIGGQEEEARK